MSIEFVFDYSSPYAYLASTQLAGLGTEVIYKPVDILDVMKRVNNQPSPQCPPKLRYAMEDARRWAAHYGVGFAPNTAFIQALLRGEVDRTLVLRAAIAAIELGVIERVNAAIFDAFWASPSNLLTDEGRVNLLDRHEVDGAALWRLAGEKRMAERLERNNEEAAERGVFGVPTIFVDGEMFFGNDRLIFVETRLRNQQVSGEAA